MTTRDRQRTRQRILDAVGRLLAGSGFAGLGINAIAKEAGVGKVLIYRYFGDLDGLLRAFVAEGDYWPSLARPAPANPGDGSAEAAADLLLGLARELRDRPLTCEALRWELVESNPLASAAFGWLREENGNRLLAQFEGRNGQDLAAVSALLAGGLIYLTLRAKGAERFLGIELKSEQGWQRIEAAARLLLESALRNSPPDQV